MTPKNVFWLSSAAACALLAASAVYFLLVYVPKRDRLQAQTAEDSERSLRLAQLETECANRARPAAQQILAEQRAIDAGVVLMGFSNHYNRRMQKCVVEVDTTSSGSYATTSSRYFFDAYENALLLSCTTVMPHDRRISSEFHCEDADLARIPPDQEGKRLKAIMSE